MNWNLILNFTAAMPANVDSVGLVPFWSVLMGDTSRCVRIRVALLTTITATLVLLIFLNVSQYVLGFFSINIPVFKVAGGFLLFRTGLSIIVEGQATQLEERDEKVYTWFHISKQRFQKVIVPLVLPLLAGPDSITTVILYGSITAGMLEKIELSVVLATMFLLFGIFTYFYCIKKTRTNRFLRAY